MMDEVDRLVAAWSRERPDLDTAPMQVWSRISRLAQLLDAARARAYSAQDLQVWEFDVLAALRRAGEPYRLTPGQLINQTHVTSGTMTNRVVRLVERGLVSRTANPADGRGVLVQLTAEGRSRVDAALADLVRSEEELVGALPADERATLAAILRKLLIAQETRAR
ncbi:MAG: MarR family transcriptional regulator [Acidobacteriota bacterium]|nr:MarR family transcriptional regulator [Acidobacteriota bacterium]NLH68877.1 MarR family transcriptional regulator [Brooklawnia sp.]